MREEDYLLLIDVHLKNMENNLHGLREALEKVFEVLDSKHENNKT